MNVIKYVSRWCPCGHGEVVVGGLVEANKQAECSVWPPVVFKTSFCANECNLMERLESGSVQKFTRVFSSSSFENVQKRQTGFVLVYMLRH